MLAPHRSLLSLCLLAALALAQPASDPLAQGFRTPPDSAKPRTWWHWTGSNVTREGITKDLEWMKRVGIGGFQMFDVGTGGGQVVEKKTIFMTPEWLEMVRHTASEAARLGLEMSMAASGGWSETGGPWVKPEQAMKKVVWSETQLTGPKVLTVRLPQPPSVNGPIRDLRRREMGFGAAPGGAAERAPDPTFYADTAVLAFPTPSAESTPAETRPKVTFSAGAPDAAPLLDDSLNTSLTLTPAQGSTLAWVQFDYGKPFTARALSLGIAASGGFGSSMPLGRIETSDDGVTFRQLAPLPGQEHNIRPINVRTFALPETTARYFRVTFTSPSFGMRGQGRRTPAARPYEISELIFHSGARVHRWEDKANFAPLFDYDSVPTPEPPANAVIPATGVVNLTSRMKPDGTLDWIVPAGRWTVLRFGYSLTGAKNSPAVPASQGFEVDKLSRKHVEAYFRDYTSPMIKVLGPLFGTSFRYLLMDSFEAGSQNWTEDMIAEFKTRRGYDPTPYLPVLAGRVVGSAEVSDRFLWDFRRTFADLFAEYHFGTMTAQLKKHNMGLYAEAAGISLPIIEDTLLTKKYLDIPMSEFWVRAAGWQPPFPAVPFLGADNRQNDYWADVRGAAAAAHVYGKPVVAAESFTGGGYEAPALLKWMGDYWATQGVNRFVFHTSAHQPLDTKPGNTMVGTHINRNITWAELAAPFMTYLARTSYLLQQGTFAADILYYTGEGIPASVPYWEKVKPEPPEGYDFDFINTDALLNHASVKDGRIVLASGTSYAVLVLPETNRMTPHVLAKVRALVDAGGVVVGPKPVASPSLLHYPKADAEVASLANEIWGAADGRSITEQTYGKGKVYWGLPLADVLALLNVPRDFEYSRPQPDTLLTAMHRRLPDGEFYFVSNQRDRAEEVRLSFRVAGKAPELWRADVGSIEPAPYEIAGGRTTVPLRLEPREAVFVVFRQDATAPSRQTPRVEATTLTTLGGPWDVSFPAGLGAPASVRLDALASLAAHPDEGVKYFSGTATYRKTVPAPAAWLAKGAAIELDLGAVRDIAEVAVNGKPLGILWKAPYRVDISGALKRGENVIEVKVTNQWTHRIAGDRQAPEGKRVLPPAPAARGFGGGAPAALPDSGLIGPVTLVRR